MLTADDLWKAEFLASMSVQTRRATGTDEATIKRECAAVAVKTIEGCIDDPREQESWLAEITRAVDRVIVETRPAPRCAP